MKNLMKSAALFMVAAFSFASCTPDTLQGSTVEAKVKTISISNAGMSGASMIAGEVDNDNYVLTFNDVPAETNVQAIKFTASLSLGAKLDAEVYDFVGDDESKLSAAVLEGKLTVINQDAKQEYKVIINLSAPASAPQIDKLVFKAGDKTYKAAVWEDEKMVLLGIDDSEAELDEIVLIPARASYEFTAMADNKLTSANPGKLILSFMGLSNEYEVSFSSSPAAGVNFDAATIHDFSVATLGEGYDDRFKGSMTRSADFNGEHVIFMYREAPFYCEARDLLAGNFNAKALNIEGMEGGTFAVSCGRFVGEHIYVCNLTTALSDEDPFKIYYYDNVTAAPELLYSWGGVLANTDEYLAGPRVGDVMSVNLDAAGNGYIFCGKANEGVDRAYRFTVENFKTITEVVEVGYAGHTCNYYGYYNQVGPNQYILAGQYNAALYFLDADGNELTGALEFDVTQNGERCGNGTDHRIVEFNRGRYMLITVPVHNTMRVGRGPVFYMLDMTEGNDVLAAWAKLDAAMWEDNLDDEGNSLWEPAYVYRMAEYDSAVTQGAPTANSAAAEIDGKLVVFTYSGQAGFALIEFPKAQ